MALIDVLIPTYRRKTGLAVVLTSLLGQTFRDFNVIVSDQTEEESYLDSIEIATLVRALGVGQRRPPVHEPKKNGTRWSGAPTGCEPSWPGFKTVV